MVEHPSNISSEYSEDKLCFDKKEFLKENFSVDEFLHRNRNIPLELLRDNMGLYLKKLRSSMIDLINEDYADFVNLSANLVGLDQFIDGIQTPLHHFRNDIVSIRSMIDANISGVRQKLESKKQLRLLKRNLQSLKKVYESSQKLENLLDNQLSESTLKAVDLERAALELLQLKFNEKFCSEYLDTQYKQRICTLEETVLHKLRILFGETLRTANSTCSEPLERCLRIYITLDACPMAEKAFKEDFVAVYMAEVITEHNLQKTPQGLAGIYSKILNFISLHMTDLLRLTQYTDKIRGFNFLVESFWSDVEWRLESHMTSIFAPGNSEVFYIKYKCTRDFLHKIEELLANADDIDSFKQHKQTKRFQARWNLPVYFQICFQEIAGDFEATLEPVFCKDTLNAKSDAMSYQLKPFTKADQATTRCWEDGVYLPELFPKFFKLHIQILLRLSHWIDDALRHLTNTQGIILGQYTKISLLIALLIDLQRLLAASSHQKNHLVMKNLPTLSTGEQHDPFNVANNTVEKIFEDAHVSLSAYLTIIKASIERELIAECTSDSIKQVSDLPRLYRKTNRDVPIRASAYVDQMFKPLKMFRENHEAQLDAQVIHATLQPVLGAITKDYFDVVSEVLTSVQKTEESLRRLRHLKGGTAVTSAPAQSSTVVMSDDDKIRLQLRIDVSTWTAKLIDVGFMPSDVEKLLDLNAMVEDTIKVK